MGEGVEKALHERTRVFVVLSRQRPPLGEETSRPEPGPGQLVELARIEVHDARRRRRRRLEGDDIVPFWTLPELAPSVAQTDLDPRVRSHPEIAVEQRCGAHDRREELRADATLQPRIAQQGARRDARPQPDDEGRAWLVAMDDEREQGLQAHVAPGWHQVARVRDALNVEAAETALSGLLLDDRNRPTRAFGVEDQPPTPRRDEHP